MVALLVLAPRQMVIRGAWGGWPVDRASKKEEQEGARPPPPPPLTRPPRTTPERTETAVPLSPCHGSKRRCNLTETTQVDIRAIDTPIEHQALVESTEVDIRAIDTPTSKIEHQALVESTEVDIRAIDTPTKNRSLVMLIPHSSNINKLINDGEDIYAYIPNATPLPYGTFASLPHTMKLASMNTLLDLPADGIIISN
eukprot:GHVO01069582.1.p1 GENE.GHVO01069582.1~~GHVO01069582.1.p1  ORF type:complete len:198 (+),score=41.16 GHVO01069582.1:3-596(+)